MSLPSTAGSMLILKGKEREFMISGWVNAFFLISAIVLGAFISLQAIAPCYSISFFLFVLVFAVLYVYIHCLKFDPKRVFIFWFPKILILLLLWLSLYFDSYFSQQVLLVIFAGYLCFDGRREIVKIFSMISKRLVVRILTKLITF